MSGLAALLAGHRDPGIYRWHANFAVADVRHTVEHAGWRFAYVDGALAQTKGEVLAALGEALEFPAHYGHNLDALVDCLRDTSLDRPLVLLWDDWGIVARQQPEDFQALLDALRTRIDALDVPTLCVLLRGEGPEPAGVLSID